MLRPFKHCLDFAMIAAFTGDRDSLVLGKNTGVRRSGMSVPGRIGIILIIALALIDAAILASGARDAATAIETHSLVEPATAQTFPSSDAQFPAPGVS